MSSSFELKKAIERMEGRLSNTLINTVVENIPGSGVSRVPSGALSYSITNTGNTASWTFNGQIIAANVASISDDTGQVAVSLPIVAGADPLLLIYTLKA
jgi:hypothetical protein